MSYILDALRRADAERERERGAVPGLYTSQLPGGAADWAPTPSRPPWLVITIGIGAGVLLIGGVAAWLAFSREPAPAPAPATVGSVSPAPSSLLPPDVPTAFANPAPPALPASIAAAALPSTPEPAAKPAAVTKAAPTAASASAAASAGAKAIRLAPPPRTAASAPPASAAKVAKAAQTEAPSSRNAGASETPALAPAAAPAAKPPRVPTLAELPADIRQQLPTLAIGGAMYSPTPSNRMLILNGQLYHEGEQPAPGLTLESIQLRSAVLSFKGQRYEISY